MTPQARPQSVHPDPGSILYLLEILKETVLGAGEPMAESVIIEEALAALQQRLHALAEPAAVAMKATG